MTNSRISAAARPLSRVGAAVNPSPPALLLQVVLLTLASIVIHESGHWVVYRLGGYAVRITLQSVRPVGIVDPTWDALALAAGPIMSVLAAIGCLAVARRSGYSFVWVCAAFTNATLRLFPCTMALARAVSGGHPFTDEDSVIASVIHAAVPRAVVIALLLGAYVALSVAVARRYRFTRARTLKAVGIYTLSLAVGIAVLLVDETVMARV